MRLWEKIIVTEAFITFGFIAAQKEPLLFSINSLLMLEELEETMIMPISLMNFLANQCIRKPNIVEDYTQAFEKALGVIL